MEKEAENETWRIRLARPATDGEVEELGQSPLLLNRADVAP